jgi:hypothetical protein
MRRNVTAAERTARQRHDSVRKLHTTDCRNPNAARVHDGSRSPALDAGAWPKLTQWDHDVMDVPTTLGEVSRQLRAIVSGPTPARDVKGAWHAG